MWHGSLPSCVGSNSTNGDNPGAGEVADHYSFTPASCAAPTPNARHEVLCLQCRVPSSAPLTRRLGCMPAD
jgi:hypothetical protein